MKTRVFMRKGGIALIVLFILAAAAFTFFYLGFPSGLTNNPQVSVSSKPNPNKTITSNSTIVMSNGNYSLEDSFLNLNGSLIINGTAMVIVRNSIINFSQDYDNQHNIMVGGNAKLLIINSEIKTNKLMYAQATGSPFVEIINYSGSDSNTPWWNTGTNSTFYIGNSIVGISVSGSSKIYSVDSNIFPELLFGSSKGTFNLPQGHVDNYTLEVPNDYGESILRIENSTVRHWGATLMYNSTVKFVNSNLTVGLNAGNWPTGINTVNVSGLKAKNYDYFNLPFDSNNLTLVNTTITSWYPQAQGTETLEISNSDLADLQWNAGNANVIVRNSTMSLVFARDNVTYNIYDSTINGDVTAISNSRINLYNTKVLGKILKSGNGQVTQS